MGLLDGLLGQIGSNADVANLAAKVGLTPDQVAQAVQALGQAHAQPGDTTAAAAEATGLPQDTLSQLVEHLGGEGALGRFAGVLGEAQQSGMLGKLEGLGANFLSR